MSNTITTKFTTGQDVYQGRPTFRKFDYIKSSIDRIRISHNGLVEYELHEIGFIAEAELAGSIEELQQIWIDKVKVGCFIADPTRNNEEK